CQSQWWPAGADQFDVYVGVVPLFFIPDEGHLVGVRRKARLTLKTRVSREGNRTEHRFWSLGGRPKKPQRPAAQAIIASSAAAQVSPRRRRRTGTGIALSAPEFDSSFSSSSATFRSAMV